MLDLLRMFESFVTTTPGGTAWLEGVAITSRRLLNGSLHAQQRAAWHRSQRSTCLG